MAKQKSLHGNHAFLTDDKELVAKNIATVNPATPDGPIIIHPGSSAQVAVFDDFLGDTGVLDGWEFVDGDTGKSATAVVTTGTNGFVRITGNTSNLVGAGGPTPAAVHGVSTGTLKQWKTNQGNDPKTGTVRFGTRIRIPVVSRSNPNRISVFAGFADTGGAEMPFHDTGGSADIATTSNGVGFLFSSQGDTGWAAVAVAGDTVQGPTVLDTGVESNVWDKLDVEISRGLTDTGTTAYFYVNDRLIASIAGPVTSNVALAPGVWMIQHDTGGGNTVDVDYIAVSGPRDTGS